MKNCSRYLRMAGIAQTQTLLARFRVDFQTPISSSSARRFFSKIVSLSGKSETAALRMANNYKHLSTAQSLAGQPATQPSNSEENDVLFETVNGKGVITLNRPKALNALNLSMCRKIYPKLREWESSMGLVIIKGTGGKAFCSGGDVRAVSQSPQTGNKLGKDFFREEYQLNALIGTLEVPYVALIDGITMGGGVGLSVHGRYRVATERTLFAMPEMAIGLFPDVGGSHFLPRMGGKLGLYLALTGYRLKGGDVFKSGVATHMCESNKLAALEQDLLSITPTNVKGIEEVLGKYHQQCPQARDAFTLEQQLPKIDKIFNASSVEEILNNLKSDNSEWSQKIIESFGKFSPTSLKITVKLLEAGAQLDLQECLKMEYRLAVRCCENNDFAEGVRALLVDKDQNPKWKPDSLAQVTQEIVDSYFAPLPDEKELSL